MERATVDRLLTTTRAVRKRLDLDRPVPREVIEECLEIAIQAPTGSNAQNWRWLVVTDPDRRRVIADAYRTAWTWYSSQSETGLAALEPAHAAQQRRVISSARYLAEHLERVPVHVIPCLLGRLPDGAPPALAASYLASIFPAVWSFQLALRSRGLGSSLTTLHLFSEQAVAEALGIPDNVTQTCLVPVAYFMGTDFSPAARRPATELTYWNAWEPGPTAEENAHT